MAEEAKNTTVKFVPNGGDYLRMNRWLMSMFVYINGARLQAAELLLDVHILNQQQASMDMLEQIQLDRDVLGGDDLAQYTIGEFLVCLINWERRAKLSYLCHVQLLW